MRIKRPTVLTWGLAGLYVVLMLAFAATQPAHAQSADSQQNTQFAALVSPETLRLMRKSMDKWVDDGFPSNDGERQEFFNKLIGTGVIPAEMTYEEAKGTDLFQYSRDLDDRKEPFFALRKVKVGDAYYRVQYALSYSKKTDKYGVVRVTLIPYRGDELDKPSTAKVIFSVNDDKAALSRNAAIAKLEVLECRMQSKRVLDEIQRLAGSWAQTEYFPRQDDEKKKKGDDSYQGFRDLFKALQKAGAIHEDAEFDPKIFGGNAGSFELKDSPLDPELTIKLDGKKFTYRLDRKNFFKVRTEPKSEICSEEEFTKRQNTYLGLRARFTNDGEKKPSKSTSGADPASGGGKK